MTENEYRLGLPIQNQDIIRYPCLISDLDTMKKRVSELLCCRTSPEKMTDVVVILAALSGYLSREEVQFIYRTDRQDVGNAFRTLLAGNRNSLVRISAEAGGLSRSYYHVTPGGWEDAYWFMGDNLHIRYSPATKDRQILHSYGAGMNVTQMLLAGIPCIWYREPKLSGEGFNKGDLESLWADMACLAWPYDNENRRRMFFEEDTGTESRNVLLNKINAYASAGRMNNTQDILVFSFFSRLASRERLSWIEKKIMFSNKRIQELRSILENTGCASLNEYVYAGFTPGNLSERCNAILRYLGGAVGVPVTGEYLKHYLDELRFLRNPWLVSAINAQHRTLARASMKSMVFSIRSEAKLKPEARRKMMRGFQVLFSATPLVADVIRWACLDRFPACRKLIIASVGSMCPGIEYEGNLTRPLSVPLGDTGEISLRNCFSFGQGRFLAVEFPCFDASAWLRVWCLTAVFRELPLSVLCVFDTDDQAADFCGMTGTMMTPAGGCQGNERLFGILRYDLGKEDMVFALSRVS